MDAEQAQFRIDQEIAALIPPPSPEEFAVLEADLVAKGGCRDKGVVWLEENILLDGHTRNQICTTHSLRPLEVVGESFLDRDSAKLWVLKNQLGRRNLSPYQRADIALKMEPLIAAKAKERQVSGGKKKGIQISGEAVRTDKKLAELAGVSHDTIAKAKVIREHATDELKEALRHDEVSINAAAEIVELGTPELQNAWASGSVSLKEAKRLAQLKPEQQREKLKASESKAGSGKTKVRSDVWSIDEVVDRVEDCLRIWSRLCHYGKLYDAAGKLNEAAVRRLYKAYKPRMRDVALWKEMVTHFLRPLELMRSIAAAELDETKKRRAC